jgi:preprotein translocase subunit SecG
MYYVIAALYVLVCLVMLFAILLQQGKGGDIASAFGGGSSQAAFGARTGATVLSKITAGAAALFMALALALSILGQRGPGSVISGTPSPKPPASTPAPSPAQQAPAAPVEQAAPGQTPPSTPTPGQSVPAK